MKLFAIISLLLSQAAGADLETSHVTMYSFKSPYGVDWSSPSNLAVSAIKNTLAYKTGLTSNPRNIGHSAIKVSCQNLDGKQREIYTGMGSVNSNKEAIDLLWKNSALGVLLHRYKGELDKQVELISDIESGQKAGDINSVTYLIDHDKCEELAAHYDEWIKRKAYLNYGLLEKPLEYTGAGCSAYAVSYLRRNNIAPEEHKKHWKRTVRISTKLVGPHNRLPYVNDQQEFHSPKKTEDGANLLELILSANKWAAPNDEEVVELEFWSPDMMYNWTKKVARQHKRDIA
ncbi:MAG: hypothetical protein WEB87_05020, partial [Bacteriovoracaceae bacterium]